MTLTMRDHYRRKSVLTEIASLGLSRAEERCMMLPAHHQQHDETTNPGMVRGAAGARRVAGHGRNDLDHDTPVCSRGGYMTMCPNDRLGRFANRSSHQFKSRPLEAVTPRFERPVNRFAGTRCDIDRHPILKSQRQSPERPSGFSVILRGRKRSLSPVTFASLLTSPGRGRRAVPSTVADGNCRGAHVAASALLFGLSQNDPYHRVSTIPHNGTINATEKANG